MIVIMEHALIFLKYILMVVIPDVPDWVYKSRKMVDNHILEIKQELRLHNREKKRL